VSNSTKECSELPCDRSTRVTSWPFTSRFAASMASFVRTNQRLRSNEVAVNSDLVRPVLWHSLTERSTASADFKTTESRNRPVPNARINQRIYFGGIEVAYFPCFRMIAMYRSI
jgi:hypothetical protein